MGGLLRDGGGNWLLGFAKSVSSGTITMAKLWDVYEGLLLAWQNGYNCIEVECDSLTTVTLIQDDCPSTHPYYRLILACKELLQRHWICHLCHVYREANKVANQMANLGHQLPWGLHLYLEPPPHVVSTLLDDCKHISTLRSVTL